MCKGEAWLQQRAEWLLPGAGGGGQGGAKEHKVSIIHVSTF